MIGFGTYRINDQNVIEQAILCGYNHFDTAELYKNERMIVQAINKYNVKERIHITTKISKKSILSGKIEESFNERLEIFEYIDILLLHTPTSDCKKDWETLCELFLKNTHRIKNIGVSNYDIKHLEQIADCKIKPYCNQIELSVFNTRLLLVDYLKKNGIIIVSHTTLTRGERLNNSSLIEIANHYSVSTAKILLKWALQNNYYVIPKANSYEHQEENINNYDFIIKQDDMAKLNSLNDNFCITIVS